MRKVADPVAVLGRWSTSRLVPDARRLVLSHSTAAEDGSMISGVWRALRITMAFSADSLSAGRPCELPY